MLLCAQRCCGCPRLRVPLQQLLPRQAVRESSSPPHRGGAQRLVQDLVQHVDGVVEDDCGEGRAGPPGRGQRQGAGAGLGHGLVHWLVHVTTLHSPGSWRTELLRRGCMILTAADDPPRLPPILPPITTRLNPHLPVLTASHSFRSSPGGRRTASSTAPVPSVCSMCCLRVSPLAPTGTFLTERKVPPFLQAGGGGGWGQLGPAG